MIISEKGYQFIEAWEGLFLHAYDDGTGVMTIGYGHTSSAGPPKVYRGMQITKDQANSILRADLASVEIAVNHALGDTVVTQDQFDALMAFDFNIGNGGFARSSLLRDIQSGHISRAKHDFEMWDRGGGRVMPGLLRRRDAEYVLFSTGKVVGP